MKKSLVALAAVLAAGGAAAQSSVTLFGVVDASVSNYSTKSEYRGTNPLLFGASRKQSQTALANGSSSSSRLGFRGTEDLGGGLAASFWLESGITNDDGKTGVAAFDRRSTVSLSGGFGEIRLGRDYTPTYWNDNVFDPFGLRGVGTSLISRVGDSLSRKGGTAPNGASASDNYARASNSIGYFLPPNLGGFYGQFQYALHENVKFDENVIESPSKRGSYFGGRVGYANGPLDVAVSYGSDNKDSTPLTATTVLTPALAAQAFKNRINTFNLGASYDLGAAKLFGEYSSARNKFDNVTTLGALNYVNSVTDKYDGFLLGVSVPVGPGQIKASYGYLKYKAGQNPIVNPALALFGNPELSTKANQFAIGYVHNLSKRTALYATLARVRIKDGQNNPTVFGRVTTGGAPAYLATAGWAPRSSTGYDFGLRHSF